MIAAAIGALVVVGCAVSVAHIAASELDVGDGGELARPANISAWPNVGATIRMGAPNSAGMGAASSTPAGSPNAAIPSQLRQVQMAPDAYESFVRTHEYPDGAAFAATIYLLRHDSAFTPEIYEPEQEAAFVMEVIDRNHPDGRRFYSFAPGATSAAALPPGNACAVCHNARGSFNGTFAQFYPAISRYTADQN
ncbi:MAG: cytochrome P460 family protein [Terricaulis sp.]